MTFSATLSGILTRISLRPRLALALFCLILWTPGVFSLPPLDRDESRFAQASKQMLESGDPVDIRFGAVPRYKKPVGIYWMQAAATEITGLGEKDWIWTYRLPSLIGAIMAVWLTFWAARGFLAVEGALLAGGLLGSTLLLTGEATIATTDAVLTACILGAQAVLLRFYLSVRGKAPPLARGTILLGWLAFGLAVLVKGPVILAVTGITVAGLCVWDRDIKWLKEIEPVWGIAIVLVVVAPWIIAIWIKSHGQFFQQSLGQDFATKLQSGQESHGAPPGYFLALVTVTFWPAILFLLPGLVRAIRHYRDPAMRVLLVWAATWVVFELVPTKLPHYVLPTYPALAMMAAAFVVSARDAATRWDKIVSYIAPVQFAVVALAFLAAPFVLPVIYGSGVIWWLILPSLVFGALAVLTLKAYFKADLLRAALLALAAPLAVYPFLTGGVGPHLTTIWVSPRAAELAHRFTQEGDRPVKLAGYLEPSLVFLLGTETRQTDGTHAAEAGAAEGGLALIEQKQDAAFQSRLKSLDTTAHYLGALDGFNYSRGRKVHIRLYRVQPRADIPPPPAE